MFRSAILKLTFWYVLLSMGLSLLLSVAVYHFASHELTEGLNNQSHAIISNDYDADNIRAISSRELSNRSSQLFSDLLYFNIVILVGSTIASYILARRTMRPIEDTHQAQVRFIAEASHELRTPLAAMRVDTESILREKRKDPHTMQTALEDNLKDIVRLEKLTDHLLQMSRYKEHSVLSPVAIDVQVLLRDTIEQLKRQYSDRKLDFIIHSVPATLSIDPVAIQQLLTIIIDNAIKYSHAGISTITITITRSKSGLSIEVSDEGIGITAQDLPHIFEHFYRSSNVKNQAIAVGGYGLGLPLAKDIVDLYGGTIAVHSTENKGATFIVTLPAKLLDKLS